MISNTKRKITFVASGLVMLLTGAVAAAQDAGAKADVGAGTAGVNSNNAPAVCSVAPVSHNLFYEGFNHPGLAVKLFRRPSTYTPLSDPDQQKESANKVSVLDRLYGSVDQRADENKARLLQTGNDIEYLVALADTVRDRILQLDQRTAESVNIAGGYINMLSSAIEQRPTLARFFAQCQRAPVSGPVNGFPLRTGPYNTCLGYKAFVARLETLAGMSLGDIRTLSPLVNELAIGYSHCSGDIGKK